MYDFAYLEDGFDDGNNCRLEQHDVILSTLVKQGVAAAAVASHGPCISAYTEHLNSRAHLSVPEPRRSKKKLIFPVIESLQRRGHIRVNVQYNSCTVHLFPNIILLLLHVNPVLLLLSRMGDSALPSFGI